MSVEISHQFTNRSALAQDLIEQGARNVARAMENITDDVVREVEDIIQSKLQNNRTGQRSKGDTKLLGSIRADVTSAPGEFPVTVAVWSTADDAKVASLEFGSGGHEINGNPFLYYPSNRISQGSGQQRGVFGRKFQATGSGKNFASFNAPAGRGSRGGKSIPMTKERSVWHPGGPAFGFMRRGLDRAVAKALSNLQ